MVVRLLTFRLLGSRLAAALALGGPAGPVVHPVGCELGRAIGDVALAHRLEPPPPPLLRPGV